MNHVKNFFFVFVFAFVLVFCMCVVSKLFLIMFVIRSRCIFVRCQDNRFVLLIYVVSVTMVISTFVSHTVAALILMPIIVQVSKNNNMRAAKIKQERTAVTKENTV